MASARREWLRLSEFVVQQIAVMEFGGQSMRHQWNIGGRKPGVQGHVTVSRNDVITACCDRDDHSNFD